MSDKFNRRQTEAKINVRAWKDPAFKENRISMKRGIITSSIRCNTRAIAWKFLESICTTHLQANRGLKKKL